MYNVRLSTGRFDIQEQGLVDLPLSFNWSTLGKTPTFFMLFLSFNIKQKFT